MNLIFGNKLNKLRKEKDVKQDVIAMALGFSQQAYSQLERGARNFTPQIVTKICNFFSIPIVEFLNYSNEVKIINSQAYTNNSSYNDLVLIQELLKSKDIIIATQKEIIEEKDKRLKEYEVLLKQ